MANRVERSGGGCEEWGRYSELRTAAANAKADAVATSPL